MVDTEPCLMIPERHAVDDFMKRDLISIGDFHPEAVVLDAGDFPSAPVPLSILDSTHTLVCCDGAAVEAIRRGCKPWRIVGDTDSLPAELVSDYRSILRRFSDQETNDQTKAVYYLLDRGITRIAILGACGKREDHTLGNISLLVEYMHRGLDTRIYTDYGVFVPCHGDIGVRCVPGTQVSIFNFGAEGLSSEGLSYPIRDFHTWWEGTLNNTPYGRFSIRARGSYLLFLTYLPKSNP